MFLSQSLSIVGGQTIRLRQDPGTGDPVRIRTEHPLIHLAAAVQFVGLLAIAQCFFVIITGDEALIDRGVKGNEVEFTVRGATARPDS